MALASGLLRPLALVGVVALFGLGVPFAATGPSAAHAAALGGPDPDPPPPPPPPPAPPPPPPPVVPPPPPPPAYVPPPPPPPAYVPPPPPPAAHKPKPKPRHVEPKAKKKTVVVSTTWVPRPPDAPLAALAPVRASVTTSSGSSSLLPLVLGLALVLALIVIAAAAMPPWVFPGRANVVAYEHRESLIAGGTAVAASIAVGLLISLLGS